MSEFTLAAEPFLGKYSQTFGATRLEEAWEIAIVSIAVPLQGETAFEQAVSDAFGVVLPDANRSTISEQDNIRIFGLAPDLYMAAFEHQGADAANVIAEKLGDVAYYTLQSDNWTCLRLTGPDARRAMERICPIDLHPSAFPVGAVTRTVMEHLASIILKETSDGYLLLSPSSSALSFLHAIETSVKNVME